MIIMLNGSFGVGKTTVACILRRMFAGSMIYDPEPVGLALRRLSTWVGLKGGGTDDFQDIELWRRSVIAGTRTVRAIARGLVIVPMTFCRRNYFDEVVGGLKRFDTVRVFCLRAEIVTILERLDKRGTADGEYLWLYPKAGECVEAHRDPHFGEPINTEGISAAEVARDIARRLELRE